MISAGMDDSTAAIAAHSTYDEYLSSQVTPLDLSYLEDEDIARQLVELGYRGAGDIVKREDFESRKKFANLTRDSIRAQKKSLFSVGKVFTDPFLLCLAEREEANRNGKLCTVIFIRDKNSKNQEISGYIDYAHRLANEDFEQYFTQKKKILPRPSDLSYFNWESQIVYGKSSPNYEIVSTDVTSLFFRNRLDRKILDVDPRSASPGDSSVRTVMTSSNYIQLALYDHITRRRL
uniref:Cilia- and flagella-associated protein 299 n=1 Tax=Strigamia maritima TaxID=126957 RepID=T1J7Q3_STRMM